MSTMIRATMRERRLTGDFAPAPRWEFSYIGTSFLGGVPAELNWTAQVAMNAVLQQILGRSWL